jgi:hypothetical protein
MSEGVRYTWADRELPILRSALRRLDEGMSFAALEEIRLEVGLDVSQMRAGVQALESASPPYLTLRLTMSGPDVVGGYVLSVSERARRELGTWPSGEDMLDRLVAALEAQAADTVEPEKQSKLRAAAAVIGGMAREVVVAVLAKRLGG